MLIAHNDTWVIKKANGQLLQSFAIDPAQIKIVLFLPEAPGKTTASKKGPLIFVTESKANVMLMALIAHAPNEFSDASVVPAQAE